MLNMSNQFYNYLSSKILNYFNKENIKKGDRFFIELDEAEQVDNLYYSFKQKGIDEGIYNSFNYIHKNAKNEFKSFSLLIDGVNLVLAKSTNVKPDYLVTLRNQVTNQEGEWENTALLIICSEPLDSIYNGMRNLKKEGMPLSINFISRNLETEINKSKKLTKAEKEVAKFVLNNVNEETSAKPTLWDFENILGIIEKGHIDDEDFKELELFKDENLKDHTIPTMKQRLKENHAEFEFIKNAHLYEDLDKELEKRYTDSGVNKLKKDDWENESYKNVKNFREKFKAGNKPLNYEESNKKLTDNSLKYWEKPEYNTAAGRRKRHIIVFNTRKEKEVSLTFQFDQMLKKGFIGKKSLKYCKTSGKKLNVKFDVSLDEPTYKKITYKHNNENRSNFIFNIVVLNAYPEVFDSIKSKYTVKADKNYINVENSDDDYEIIFGSSNNRTEKSIEDKNEIIYLYDNESIIISEESPAWNEGDLNFDLHYNDNDITFKITEKKEKTHPVDSSRIWEIKREYKGDFVYNGTKAILGVNSFYLKDEFKKYLDLEREIIDNNVFYGTLNVDNKLSKVDVQYSERLTNAYQDILNYFKTYDDSPEDNLPSLIYLNNDLEKLYENFINVFNEEIESIESNSFLNDDDTKKDLLKLGRIDTKDKIMYSSFSPINIAYQLEIKKQSGDEKLENNMVKRLVPNNLIPYVCSDDGKTLYKPIYQESAHEWVIYKKSKEVSIGTTNIFIKNVVSEKLDQFIKHFNYLFEFNPKAALKINVININDDKEVVKGVFSFVRSRLPDKLKTKDVIPVEVHIYSDSHKSSFDTFSRCRTKEEFDEEFGLKLSSKTLDEIDILHLVQNNIKYFKHPLDVENYEYAHISFYKGKSASIIANDNMDDIETGLSLNGLLSSVTSTTKHKDYRNGFGTKNILDKENQLVKTSINMNELVENSRNYGKNTYSKNKTIITTVELEEDNIEQLYDKSHWVTFIEPAFGIEYFNKTDNDLIIIHYSDQYSSSSRYDTITVTNKSVQYEDIINDFLRNKEDIEISKDEIISIIKMFNCINGEWLLRLISSKSGNYDMEKLSLVSAIKYSLAIYDHKDIIWIPISMEEILRIAGNVKLSKNEGIFSSDIEKGSYSDDLLLIGLKTNDDGTIEILYYPIEVKAGRNDFQTINKGKNQLNETYNLLKNQLKQFDNEGSEFKNKFFRNFFIQIFISNAEKLNINHIWDEKDFSRIEEFKSKLLNDDYIISYILEDKIGKGTLVSFKRDCFNASIAKEDGLQIIELPMENAYLGLVDTIEDMRKKIQSNSTDIEASDLLFNDNDLGKFDIPKKPDGPIGDDGNGGGEKHPKTHKGPKGPINPPGPPEPPMQKDSLENVRVLIGTQDGYDHKVYWEYGNSKLPNRHMLIQGKSGQGKTYFIQRVLKELSKQNIPSIIIDYTDGFKKSKLEEEFKKSVGNNLDVRTVVRDKFSLNPFKSYKIEIDEGEFMLEDEIKVASRFKNLVGSVYNFGDQQLNTIYNAVIRGIKKHGYKMDFEDLKDELMNEDSSVAGSVLNKLTELLDINPFISDDFDWSSILDKKDGKILIIQLTGLSSDIQNVITELILWDLWHYKTINGDEKNPFAIVLDEAQNLDFGKDSPSSKILKEGRKFGWSGIFATQSVQSFKSEELDALENVDEKIYFHPTDNSITKIAGILTKDNNRKKDWEKKLTKLTKGQCVVQGEFLNSNDELKSSEPVIVNVDEIIGDEPRRLETRTDISDYDGDVLINIEKNNKVSNQNFDDQKGKVVPLSSSGNEVQSLKRFDDSILNDSEQTFDEADFEDYIEFNVKTGLSYKNHGWAIKRGDIEKIIPKSDLEEKFVYIDGKMFKVKISSLVRIFYHKDEEIENYLKEKHLRNEDKTKIRLFLNDKIEKKVEPKNRISFKTTFTEQVKNNGTFVVPREISQYFVPKNNYEDICYFTIDGRKVVGHLNLIFRMRIDNNSRKYLNNYKFVGDDLEVTIPL